MKILKRKSPNFTKGTMTKTIVILHFTLGSPKGAINELINSMTKKSAHAVFAENGQITELVELKDDAWAAGNIYNPSSRGKKVMKKNWYGKYINPNKYAVQLEICAGWDRNKDGVIKDNEYIITKNQLDAIVFYLRKVEKNNQVDIKLTPENIINHSDITSYKPNLELTRKKILRKLMTLKELKRSRQGGFYFCKKGDNGKQKIPTDNKGVAGLLTVISREFGVETVSDEFLDNLKDKIYF